MLFDKMFALKIKKAYTLAEVVIVMLIIAVVVSVCIKITKVKMDNILKVVYYVSYNTLDSIIKEIFLDAVNKKYASDASITSDCWAKVGDSEFYCIYSGQAFCEKFLEYANTSSNLAPDSRECNGDSILYNLTTDFSSQKADIVLRNGMKLFNVRQNPIQLADLGGNTRGKTGTTADGTNVSVDLDEWAYIVYIDIDGDRAGESNLWEDVYPFFITLSGTVIPAYDADNPGESGGDSRLHLQTSVSDRFTDSGQQFRWVTQSESFKESACKMGLVKSSDGGYCNAVEFDNDCATNDSHDCKLKVITPIKFFN